MLLISGVYVFQSSLVWASGPLAIMGITIYLLVIATTMRFDWRGFLTMNGFLKWKSMTGKQRLIAGWMPSGSRRSPMMKAVRPATLVIAPIPFP